MFKQVRLHDAILKFYQRSQPIAFSNAETLYDDLVLLRDQILMYGDLSEAQTNYLNEFIEKFDVTLNTTVKDILEVWLDNNLLTDLIRDVINEEVIEARDGEARLNLRLNRDKQDSETEINLLKGKDIQLTSQVEQSIAYQKNLGVALSVHYDVVPHSVDPNYDNSVEIQRAIDYCQSNGKTLVLDDLYGIKNSLIVKTGTKIIGTQAVISADVKSGIIAVSEMDKMITFVIIGSQASSYNTIFSDFSILGNNLANYGAYGLKLSEFHAFNLRISHCKEVGLFYGTGWLNTFDKVHVSHCGTGILGTESSIHAGLFINCTITLNDVGVHLATNGSANLFTSCVIENNSQLGIYLQALCHVNIENTYFENNGSEGYLLDDGTIIYTNIFINGSADPRVINSAYPVKPFSLKGCSFGFMAESVKSALFIGSGSNYIIENNRSGYGVITLVEYYGDTTGSKSALNALTLRNNENFEKEFDITNLKHVAQREGYFMSDCDFDKITKKNYFKHIPADNFVEIGITEGSSLSDISLMGGGYRLTKTTTGRTTSYFYTIPLTDYPELKGKVIYASARVKQSTENANLILTLRQETEYTSSISTTNNTEWRTVEVVGEVSETDTEITLAIHRTGGTAETIIDFGDIVIAEVGTPKNLVVN